MTEPASTLRIYRRLLKYAMPYKSLLAVGILAGALTGVFSVGILNSIPSVLGQLGNPSPPTAACTDCQGTAKLVCSTCGKPINSVVSEPQGTEQDTTTIGRLKDRVKGLNPAPYLMKRLNLPTDPEKQRGHFGVMSFMIGIIGFLLFMQMAMTVINRFCMRWVGVRVVKDIRGILFKHIQTQSMAFYSKSNIGELISRVNNDTTAIERSMSATIADMTRAPFEILLVVAFLINFTVDHKIYVLWLLVLVVTPLVFLPILHLSRRIKSHVGKSFMQISILHNRMHEVFTGIRIVKAFNMGDRECEQFDAVNNSYVKRLIRALRSELAITVVLGMTNIVIACCIVVYCFANSLEMEQVMQLVMAAMFIYAPSKRLAKVNTQIQRSAAAGIRIFEMLDQDTSIKEQPDAEDIDAFNEVIRFENVEFKYTDGEPLLQDLNFDMPKGAVIAFVGRAGSGKSTIANMIPRFFDPTGGQVTIDGRPLNQLRIASLRSLIGMVTQDTILFNDSIVNNITYGSDTVDMDRVVQAAKRARAHEFIMEKDGGYDFVVGDKGVQLSGGQKQRIAIARALYRDPQILILDEATSALDSVTEKLVQEALDELMKDRTVFAIAHRLSTIRHAQKICVLEDGKIVESGTHEELLAMGGKYTQMTDIQDS